MYRKMGFTDWAYFLRTSTRGLGSELPCQDPSKHSGSTPEPVEDSGGRLSLSGVRRAQRQYILQLASFNKLTCQIQLMY